MVISVIAANSHQACELVVTNAVFKLIWKGHVNLYLDFTLNSMAYFSIDCIVITNNKIDYVRYNMTKSWI